jgi:hypothetical protein
MMMTMIEKEYHDRIDRYCSDLMSAKEKQLFEDELKKNQELRNLYKIYMNVSVVVNDKEAYEFVDLVVKDLNKEKTERRRKYEGALTNWGFRIAALIIVLVSVGTIIVFFMIKQSKESKAISGFFIPPEIHYNFRSHDNEGKELMKNGILLYNNKDYIGASKNFRMIFKNDTSNHQIGFYLGLAELFSGKIDEAKMILHQIYVSEDLNYSSDAQWYLVWCYIQEDSIRLARKNLHLLKQNDYYSEKAINLLKLMGDD